MSKANVQSGIFLACKMRKNGSKKLSEFSRIFLFRCWGHFSIQFSQFLVERLFYHLLRTTQNLQTLPVTTVNCIHNQIILKFVILRWVFTLAIIKPILHFLYNALPFISWFSDKYSNSAIFSFTSHRLL